MKLYVILFFILFFNKNICNSFLFRSLLLKYNKKYCLIDKSTNKKYLNNEIFKYIENNPILKNKKLITISPGGLKGFYMLGVSIFLKMHYDTINNNYIFSGSSAGAWNSLIMCYKNDNNLLYLKIYKIIKILNQDIKTNSLSNILQKLKILILENFDDNDFNFNNIFIGITKFDLCSSKIILYTNFTSLTDVIDCCLASSHIPFLTGNFINKYNNILSFDGGFSRNPYLQNIKPILQITPYIWEKNENKNIFSNFKNKLNINDYTTLFSKNNYNLNVLFEKGFIDCITNKIFLDELFTEDIFT